MARKSLKDKENVKDAMAQSNVITSAKEDLNRTERRILYLFLRDNYLQVEVSTGMFVIEPKEYAKTFKMNINDARAELRKGVMGLRGKCVHLKRADGTWIEYDWTNIREERKRGVYAVSFNPALLPYLDVFSQDDDLPYTLLSLEHASNLKSKWGQRLYNSLCQWRSTGQFRILLKDLVETWRIPDGYQGRWQDVRRYVIEPAVEDVRANTDMTALSYDLRREGGRNTVVEILFSF